LGVEAGLPDARFARLGLLKAKGSPPIRVTLLEDADPASPTGAKGAGSIGLVPTPAAVAAALRQQEGAFREALPLRGSAASKAAGARAR
jgi:CO/xanthine dehydrogenase Mo-binding subunit